MIAPRRLRAPEGDGAVVAEPPLAEVGQLLSRNRAHLQQTNLTLLDRSLAELRRQARKCAIDEARAYLREAGEPVPPFADGPLLMAGHQPELFHPGVWAKNFALHGLARKYCGIALNLVVDNDTAKATALRVPTRTTDAVPWPHALMLAYDRWVGEVPYEEREVADEDQFTQFSKRVVEAMRGWDFTPLVQSFWEQVRLPARRTRLLGERLAAARRHLERAWGSHNFEVPVSRLCKTESFAWFACHVLLELPRFHAVYNAAVHDYRRVYELRSRNHPVPDLVKDGDWLEAPFWGWRVGQTRRGRLLVRRRGTALELHVGTEAWPTLPIEKITDHWKDLEGQGFKVRSRALTNTLYARMFVSDLFVHGIGGGKYDELTDDISRRFYGIAPPAFLVLSATKLLPAPRFAVETDDVRRLAREVRDLEYNPQRHVNGEEVRDLIAAKAAWIALAPVGAEERRRRFTTLRDLNRQMRPRAEERIRTARRALEERRHWLTANAVLNRRDYSFCLFPEETLRPFVTQFQ